MPTHGEDRLVLEALPPSPMPYIYSDGYGSGCCQPCDPVPSLPLPPPPCPKPEPVECPEGYCPEPPPCHCYLEDFLCQFPGLAECHKAEHYKSLCCLLKQAECYTRGVHDLCIRREATLYMAAHLSELPNIAATEAASRAGAIDSGQLSRPGSGSPGLNDWLSLTVWGMAYMGVVRRDSFLPILMA